MRSEKSMNKQATLFNLMRKNVRMEWEKQLTINYIKPINNFHILTITN